METNGDASMKNGDTGAELDIASAPHDFDYDLFVIGGGSGGLACAKEAALFGAKVAVADFVKPSPQGTTWKIGGTCVNVGCIPKKLMHYAGILGESHHDQINAGWVNEKPKHDWSKMIYHINNHIHEINFGYKKELKSKNVKYYNEFASFVDEHTILLTDKKGKTKNVTSKYFVIAVGGRPSYPDIPGAKEYGISSDDLFWLKEAPGKTLVVGASYVALECAGFMLAYDYDVTVMVRSIFLRGFDQDMAEKIGKDMEVQGTKFIRNSTPTKLEKNEETGKIIAYYTSGGEELSEEYDTVMFAIGRYAVTKDLNLDNAGIIAEKNGKFKTDKYQRTNVENVYAIGDVIDGQLELTPTAIQCGKLLARRLFNGGTTIMDFYDIPTTVFTPLEYGCVGYSEEDAREEFGKFIKVYHTYFTPLEWNLDKVGRKDRQ